MTQPNDNDRAGLALKWWLGLQPKTADDGRRLPGDRPAVARLRRATSTAEALAEPATARLCRSLGVTATSPDLDRVAALAVVLAHVRTDDRTKKFAAAIGIPAGGDPVKNAGDAKVKRTRFLNLVKARSGEEIMTAFRRVVAILGNTANVRDLARLILGWRDDEAGDRLRAIFSFEYHGAALAAPPATTDTSETAAAISQA